MTASTVDAGLSGSAYTGSDTLEIDRIPDLPGLDAEPNYLELGLWERGPALPDTDNARELNPTLRIASHIVRFTDPVTEVESLFSLSNAMRSILHDLRSDPDTIDAIAPPLRERLVALGALQDMQDVLRRRRAWQALITTANKQFVRRGYVNLPRLLTPAHLAWLRLRYRSLVRQAALAHGDSQCPTRWIAHNEAAARVIHPLLTGVISDIAGIQLKPSYVYLGCYEAGSILPEHTDRAQCEYSITMLIDYLPEPDGESPWPIQLRVSGKPVAVRQNIGDALLYRGTRLPHFRDELPKGQMSSSLFFHFVSKDFDGPLE